MKTLALVTFVTLVLGVIALAAPRVEAQRFIPFTPVVDVCPECPRPHLDRIELNDGRVVLAVILLENHLFYLVERNRELRAVRKELIKRVTRSDRERPSASAHVDQILLANGHVLSGRIIAEHPNGTYELASARGGQTYRARRNVIDRIFKAGRQVVPPS